MNNSKGLKRIMEFKSNKKDELTLSFLFKNISSISDYVVNFDNRTYRILNKYLPGPYAFILNSKVIQNKICRIITIGINTSYFGRCNNHYRRSIFNKPFPNFFIFS